MVCLQLLLLWWLPDDNSSSLLLYLLKRFLLDYFAYVILTPILFRELQSIANHYLFWPPKFPRFGQQAPPRFDMSPPFVEYILTFCSQKFWAHLVLPCTSLRSAISSHSSISSQWKLFGKQDQGAECAHRYQCHCFQSLSVNRSRRRVYVHMCAWLNTCTHIYLHLCNV